VGSGVNEVLQAHVEHALGTLRSIGVGLRRFGWDAELRAETREGGLESQLVIVLPARGVPVESRSARGARRLRHSGSGAAEMVGPPVLTPAGLREVYRAFLDTHCR
jgi:hypothetical protein